MPSIRHAPIEQPPDKEPKEKPTKVHKENPHTHFKFGPRRKSICIREPESDRDLLLDREDHEIAQSPEDNPPDPHRKRAIPNHMRHKDSKPEPREHPEHDQHPEEQCQRRRIKPRRARQPTHLWRIQERHRSEHRRERSELIARLDDQSSSARRQHTTDQCLSHQCGQCPDQLPDPKPPARQRIPADPHARAIAPRAHHHRQPIVRVRDRSDPGQLIAARDADV